MAIDLNHKIGPFPLKLWLVIGVGGIGAGYLVSKQFAGNNSTANMSAGVAPAPTAQFGPLQHVIGNDMLPQDVGVIGRIQAQFTDQLSGLQQQLSASQAKDADLTSKLYDRQMQVGVYQGILGQPILPNGSAAQQQAVRDYLTAHPGLTSKV